MLVHDAYPDNVGGRHGRTPPPDAGRPFSIGAPTSCGETIYQQAYAPVPMETRGMVAEWTRRRGELTIWAATQTPHEVRMFCARLLGLPASTGSG